MVFFDINIRKHPDYHSIPYIQVFSQPSCYIDLLQVKSPEVYLFQTNNADFRGTDENQQQLAIARLRAIETGRPVVNISTVGTSQVMDASGRTIDALPAYESGTMVTDVELREGFTPAVVLGGIIPTLITLGGLAGLVFVDIRGGMRNAPRRTGSGRGDDVGSGA